MKLSELIKSTKIKKIIGWIDEIEIDKISINSREINKNTLFIAQKGENFDGHNFIDEAIINGAVALIVEIPKPDYSIPQIVVKNTRIACTTIASEFYGNPKNKLKFIGVTGTNGKTSCAMFISEILNFDNKNCAVIGTLGAFFKDKEYKVNLTTPDPIPFHKLLLELIEDGAKYVAMECSAHALALKKVDNIDFEIGILTNITQDHLDYFKDMKTYAKSKLSWILSNKVKIAIINSDDNYAINILRKRQKILSYGLDNPADVFAVDIQHKNNGTKFVINLLDNVFSCETNLVGNFNVYNTLAVITGAICLGIKFTTVVQAIKFLKAPTGRFNIIDLGDNKTIIVDFAHTPDGLEKALITAKKVCKGELISVFGCGGDRDKTKRAIMGSISEKIANFTILTSDNPRFEKPDLILSEIEKGIRGHNYFKIADRKLAIRKVVEMLKPNDIAVVCGKGGELYQDIMGIKIPYNDFEEIENATFEILGKKIVNNKEHIC